MIVDYAYEAQQEFGLLGYVSRFMLQEGSLTTEDRVVQLILMLNCCVSPFGTVAVRMTCAYAFSMQQSWNVLNTTLTWKATIYSHA